MAQYLYMLRRDVDCLEILLSWQHPPPQTYAQIAACYGHLRQMDKATEAAATFCSTSAANSDLARYAKYHARICQIPADQENWLSG